jgi:hypothetical protein
VEEPQRAQVSSRWTQAGLQEIEVFIPPWPAATFACDQAVRMTRVGVWLPVEGRGVERDAAMRRSVEAAASPENRRFEPLARRYDFSHGITEPHLKHY